MDITKDEIFHLQSLCGAGDEKDIEAGSDEVCASCGREKRYLNPETGIVECPYCE